MNRKATILTTIVVLSFLWAGSLRASRIVYVDVNATGSVNDGSSWIQAFTDLQEAILNVTMSPAGQQATEIWVAKGIYKPDPGPGSDPRRSFQLIDGVAIYGGFSGLETERSQRDPNAHGTILSGDLAGNDTPQADPCGLTPEASWSENSYHVVYSYDNNETAILDGFTITAGHARGSDPNKPDWDEYGGGMVVGSGTPTIVNCRFIENRADYGACISTRDNGSPVVTGCEFRDNAAIYHAGVLYIHEGNPRLTGCLLVNNEAQHGLGGAIFNNSGNEPTITNCTFLDNKALEFAGGAVYNHLLSDARVIDCNFLGNEAWLGGAIFNDAFSFPVISDCNFVGNEAVQGWGGAIFNTGGSECDMTRCRFSDNKALEQSGGAIFNDQGSSVIVIDCNFLGNEAQWGGAVCNEGESLVLVSDCNFLDNQASWGAGLYNNRSGVSVVSCAFRGNHAQTSGGGLYNYQGAPALNECAFAGNIASYGAGIYNDQSDANVVDCEFSGNDAETSGGAIYNGNNAASISACRFVGNHARYGGGLYNYRAAASLVRCGSIRNKAGHSGGAVRNEDCSSFRAVHCLFADNEVSPDGGATGYGGAVLIYGQSVKCSATFTLCTFTGNRASVGNQILCDSQKVAFPSDVRLTNCILWDQGPKVYKYDSTTVTIRYTDVAGGQSQAASPSLGLTWGPGNTSTDPQFTAPNEDNYRLKPGSPCISRLLRAPRYLIASRRMRLLSSSRRKPIFSGVQSLR